MREGGNQERERKRRGGREGGKVNDGRSVVAEAFCMHVSSKEKRREGGREGGRGREGGLPNAHVCVKCKRKRENIYLLTIFRKRRGRGGGREGGREGGEEW